MAVVALFKEGVETFGQVAEEHLVVVRLRLFLNEDTVAHHNVGGLRAVVKEGETAVVAEGFKVGGVEVDSFQLVLLYQVADAAYHRVGVILEKVLQKLLAADAALRTCTAHIAAALQFGKYFIPLHVPEFQILLVGHCGRGTVFVGGGAGFRGLHNVAYVAGIGVPGTHSEVTVKLAYQVLQSQIGLQARRTGGGGLGKSLTGDVQKTQVVLVAARVLVNHMGAVVIVRTAGV